MSQPAAAGATGVRSSNRGLFTPFEKVTIDPGLPNEETRTVATVPPATTACSSRPTSTRRTTRAPR
jgi:hypothetical protein